jgi:hypothetical protein
MQVMGITAFLRKIFLVDLIQRLIVTFRHQDPKESIPNRRSNFLRISNWQATRATE